MHQVDQEMTERSFDTETQEAREPSARVPSASAAWDAGVADRDRERLSAYLEAAAEMTPVQEALARAIALMRIGPGDRVLDIGCGTGASLPELARAVTATGMVVGLDHAAALLDKARSRVDNAGFGAIVRLNVGDAYALPYPDAAFDAALISRVLIHLADPDRALREARRVVKPGGWVAAIEPDFEGMRVDHVDPRAGRLLVAGHNATIRNPGMGLELFRRMDDAGFVERTLAWVTEFETVYDPELTPYFRIGADHVVAAGWLDRDQADAAVDYLIEAGERGRYASYSSLIVTAGRVPS
jgi:SAM-dependent methyltransferase